MTNVYTVMITRLNGCTWETCTRANNEQEVLEKVLKMISWRDREAIEKGECELEIKFSHYSLINDEASDG